MNTAARPLIIGYGNPLRSDDGVGQRAASALAAQLGDQAEVIVCHQLTPELAEPLSRASRALFIDVSVAGQPGTIATRVVAPDGTDSGPLSHHLSAATLLLMAERLFGHAPPTTLLTVSGTNFDHGEQLSPAVAAALPRLVHQALDSLRVVSHA